MTAVYIVSAFILGGCCGVVLASILTAAGQADTPFQDLPGYRSSSGGLGTRALRDPGSTLSDSAVANPDRIRWAANRAGGPAAETGPPSRPLTVPAGIGITETGKRSPELKIVPTRATRIANPIHGAPARATPPADSNPTTPARAIVGPNSIQTAPARAKLGTYSSDCPPARVERTTQ